MHLQSFRRDEQLGRWRNPSIETPPHGNRWQHHVILVHVTIYHLTTAHWAHCSSNEEAAWCHDQLRKTAIFAYKFDRVARARLCERIVSHTSRSSFHSVSRLHRRHIQAFADALQADDMHTFYENHGEATSPGIPATPPPASARIRKVSALSDFAPVNLKVKKRRKKERSHDKRRDWLFLLLRWPLLVSSNPRKMHSVQCVDKLCSGQVLHLFIYCRYVCYATPLIIFLTPDTGEFGLYVVIRQLVNTKEWISACASFVYHIFTL